MKNKKGFTLIELLAIIVILAIIAVITIPIILNVVDNAKKGSVIDSTYGYKDAIEKFYVEKLTQDTNFKLNGTYSTNALKNLGVSVSGLEPTDGWVLVSNNQVKDYSLKFDDYVVNYDNDNVTAIKGGTVLETSNFIIAQVIDGVGYFDALSVKNNPVYYNPITGQTCNVDDTNGNYHEDNSKAGYNGITNSVSTKTSNNTECLKWYKYSVNTDGTVNMILDHNTSVGVQWYTSIDNSKAAVTVLTKMNGIITDGSFTTVGDTSGWTGVPSRTDSYTATWNSGFSNMTSTIDYTGYKSRLITAQEVANIVGQTTFNEKTTIYSHWFYFGSLNQKNYSQQNAEQQARQRSYSWLFDNLYSSASNGGEISQAISGNYAYWTSSPTSGSSNYAWNVYYGGTLCYANTSYASYGARPVITISES